MLEIGSINYRIQIASRLTLHFCDFLPRATLREKDQIMPSQAKPQSCQLLPTTLDSTAFVREALCAAAKTSQQFSPSTWVKLRQPLTAYSFDEAWLLCEYDDRHWLAWVPDYGEVLLSINDLID